MKFPGMQETLRKRQVSNAQFAGLLVVFVWFFVGGILHFTATATEASIVPPYIPWPVAAVLVSGVFELLGAIGILIPRTRRSAGIGLFMLTLAVTPAHVYMLQRPELFHVPMWALWLRLPIQAALLWLIWWSTWRLHRRAGGLRPSAVVETARQERDPQPFMKLEQAKYSCYACGSGFKAADIPAGAYGEFLLRNAASGELRYLAALSDRTYDEVDNILRECADHAAHDARKRAKILRDLYGAVACDTDLNGNVYELCLPPCPSCSASTVCFVECMEPPEFVSVDVPPVTHSSWNALSFDEKKAAVSERLRKMRTSYFSERDLGLIEALQYDRDLRPSYECIKSCLAWNDERPDNLTPDGYDKLTELLIARSFIHQGNPFSSWLLGPKRFERVWAQASAANFSWPGFKRMTLSVADQKYFDACLADEGDI